MLTRKELKQNAKQQLSEKWGKSAVFCLIYGGAWLVIILLIGLIGSVSNIIELVCLICATIPALVTGMGFHWHFLRLQREEIGCFSDVFLPFWQVAKIIAIAILLFFVQLPFCLLANIPSICYILHMGGYIGETMIIPLYIVGLIVCIIAFGVFCYISLTYAMITYIMYDQNELGVIATMKRSAALMKGHKWDLFILQLSFLGWFLLGVITCGILLLWISPYISTTIANFYDGLLQQEQKATGAAIASEKIANP